MRAVWKGGSLHHHSRAEALHFDEHDESKNLHGKIVGPGTRKGTLLMQHFSCSCARRDSHGRLNCA